MSSYDLINISDEHFHLYDSSKKRGKIHTVNVRDISCCINKSDLCYKRQVEKNSGGKIKVWTGTGTTMEKVNVRTHAKRYAYCSANPDSIYCVNDEDGDAFTAPPSCGGQNCTVQACEDAYTQSELHDACAGNPTYSYEYIVEGTAAGPNCTIRSTCGEYSSFTLTWLWEDVDDLVYCPDSTPKYQVGSCPE